MLDAQTGIVGQDLELADRVVDEGRACVIALNKWDIVPEKGEKTYIDSMRHIRATLNHLKWAEV